MTTHNYSNPATQAERKAIITSERNTFLSRTDPDEETGGRFKREKTRTTIVGVNPASVYPPLPQSSPWAAPCPSGVERPFGIDVNDLGFDRSALGADVAPASGSSPPAAVEIETPASIPSNKLRRV